MKIYSVSNYQNVFNKNENINFSSNKSDLSKKALATGAAIVSPIILKFSESKKQNISDSYDSYDSTENFSTEDKALKAVGIKLVGSGKDHIFGQTINGGYFKIQTLFPMDDLSAKFFVYSEITAKESFKYDIKNYQKFVDSLSRFDILSKGLRLHNYELKKVSKKQKEKVAKDLSNVLKTSVSQNKLFVMDDEVHYFDISNKTVYSVRLTDKAIAPIDVSTCQYISDDKDNIIGYKLTQYDIVSGTVKTKEYKEQQTVSQNLPEIVDLNNTLEFTEACRFGNMTYRGRMEDAVNKISKYIKNNIGNSGITKDDLQYVKFKNNGGIQSIICYFNPKTGKSHVFDLNGRYKFSVVYIKDADGNIVNYNTCR